MRRVILEPGEVFSNKHLKRTGAFNAAALTAATAIIEGVRERGDEALRAYTEQFDGVRVEEFRVSQAAIAEAIVNVDDKTARALRQAAAQIRDFHERQKQQSWFTVREDGALVGSKVEPLESVGIYVPGGRALYPSSVLMNALPAAVAGVKRIVCVTPPTADGTLDPAILEACRISGVTEIYAVGGAQAVAALAYGTESVPKVDKIVGPGNIFVAAAKRRVYGIVDIDMIAGPSEILVLADAAANPAYVAADLLSQAEHDRLATAVLVCDSEALAGAVSAELERQIPLLPRADIARASIDNNGKIIIARDMAEGVDIANEIAPEHLEVCVDDPFSLLNSIRNAGSIFLGKNVPEALGDYFAGPNHTLPTLGTARFSSPLSVDDFVKKSSFIYYTKEALGAVQGARLASGATSGAAGEEGAGAGAGIVQRTDAVRVSFDVRYELPSLMAVPGLAHRTIARHVECEQLAGRIVEVEVGA